MTESTTPQPQPESSAEPAPANMSKLVSMLSKPWVPYAFAAVVLSAAALVALDRQGVQVLPSSKLDVVVFDPVRFLNAQRAAASVLVATQDPSLSLTLTQVAKQAEPVIKSIANGSIVLVRQAVVTPGDLRDITNEVIDYFGLPQDVPSIGGFLDRDIGDVAPTDLAFTQGQRREDYRIELEERQERAIEKNRGLSRQEQVLP